jgi:AP-1 complex subunit gamma-1
LALTAIGNIASPEICRDLMPEVEKLLSNANPYIRKKASLCAVRALRKVPDLVDGFQLRGKGLLSDKYHGPLISTLTLLVELCDINPACIISLRKYAPDLVKVLKNLVMSGSGAVEYDVQGITDPFLQCRLLILLKYLARDSKETAETINDILAQVTTNTDHTKNVGNCVLYEAVRTIMNIESEAGLRVLAINILGRFLTNKDNNIRYVALNELGKVVHKDAAAVAKHRTTIVACLKDHDISIRRRALDLVYSLIDESSVKALVRELLAFLVTSDNEFKFDLSTRICLVVDKYAPNRQWHFDTILKVFFLFLFFSPVP